MDWNAALRADPIIRSYIGFLLGAGRIRTQQDADDVHSMSMFAVARTYRTKFRTVDNAQHNTNRFRLWVKMQVLQEQRRLNRTSKRLTHSEDLNFPDTDLRFESQIESPNGSKGAPATIEAAVLAREILESTNDKRARVVAVGVMTGLSLKEIGDYIGYSKSTGGNLFASLHESAKGLVAEPTWSTLPMLPAHVGITFVARQTDAGKLRDALSHPLPLPVIRRVKRRISELSADGCDDACVPA